VTRTVRSYCRICQAHCGITIELDGQDVVRVAGDPEHPVSQGYTCSKGRALGVAHHDPSRLEQPELRGRPASWDEVLADLAASFTSIVDEHGPGAIACYRSTGWVLDTNARNVADRWIRALGTNQVYSPATIDTPNRMLVPDLMLGAPFVQPVVDWDETQALLVVGHNVVVSHGHATAVPDPVRRIRAIQGRGGSVVVVDPRRTETAQLADLHLQIRPGTDAALLAFLVRDRLRTRCDRDYLDAFTDAGSLARLRTTVEQFDRERVAGLCGIDTEVLDRAALLLAAAPRLSTITGTGVSMGPAPNATEWLVWALSCVTGSLDRRGGLLFNPGVIRPQSESGPTTLPRETGPPPASHPELAHAYGEYPSAILCDEILSGRVRAVFSFGGNILASFPDSKKTATALGALDVLAVSELRHTQTTGFATHVLPTCGQLERHDVTFFLDQAFPVPFAQYTEPVVEPVGDRRELWRIVAELARRMGLELPAVATIESSEELIRSVMKRSRVSLDELKAAPSGMVVDAPREGWLVPDKLPRGVLDLAPQALVEELDRWLTHAAPTEDALLLVCRRLPHQMNSDLHDLPSQQRPPFPNLLVNPEDADRLGVDDGDVVTVTSRTGSTDATVERTDKIRLGVVSLPHSWRSPDVNGLTNADDLDPLTGMPRYSGIRVEVARRGA
jgi:anaerobic selenocysteine-containing dehydrogenase